MSADDFGATNSADDIYINLPNFILDALAGNDTVQVQSWEAQSISIDGGDGDDAISVDAMAEWHYVDYDDSTYLGYATVQGGAGNDTIALVLRGMTTAVDAGDGNDVVFVDRFFPGRDEASLTLTTGSGSDTISLSRYATQAATVTDFTPGAGGDRIDLSRLLSAAGWDGSSNPFADGTLHLVQDGANVQFVARVGGTDRVLLILENTAIADFTGDNFVPPYPTDGSELPGLVVTGTDGDDLLQGDLGADSLLGLAGYDTLLGGSGSDTLDGGSDDDTLSGDAGADSLLGGDGNDALYGGAGNDTLLGGAGDDYLNDDSGNGSMNGGDGADVIDATYVSGAIEGGDGADTIYAYGTDQVTISGDAGNDAINLDSWRTQTVLLDGGAGDDVIFVHAYRINNTYNDFLGGSITVAGGDGNDDISVDLFVANGLVDGGAGDDTIRIDSNEEYTVWGDPTSAQTVVTTGAGRDTILLSDYSRRADNHVLVTDFTAGPGGDVLDLSNIFSALPSGWDGVSNPFALGYIHFDQIGADAVLLAEFNGHDVVLMTLAGVDVSTLTVDNIAGSFDPQVGVLGPLELFGTPGEDTLTGGRHDDTIFGDAGNDLLTGNGGADWLAGDADNDSLYGGDGNDTLAGGDGVDLLVGDVGNDVLIGGAGDDDLEDNSGANSFDAGAGDDMVLSYGGGATISGGEGADYMDIGNAVTADIRGDEGNDSVQAYSGYVTQMNVDGGADDDMIYAEATGAIETGYDPVTYSFTYTLTGAVTVAGGDGNDTIYADLDVASGVINGGSGNDSISIDSYVRSAYWYGATNQHIEITTGEGRDTVGLSGWMWDRDNVTEVTDFTAGAGGDVLDLGNVFWNMASGWDGVSNPFDSGNLRFEQRGADTVLLVNFGYGDIVLITLANVDMATLTGDNIVGAHNPLGTPVTDDLVLGGPGDDYLEGGAGNDTLQGLDGYDTLVGGDGADSLEGGNDRDVADYRRSGAGVSVDLGLGLGLGGTAEGDTLTGIEEVWGSAHADTLTGSAGDDTLHGNGSNDTLTGAEGNDALYGGENEDLLEGGDGDDSLYGGNGVDTLSGGAGNDYLEDTDIGVLDGGTGNDTLYSSWSEDELQTGGEGNDQLYAYNTRYLDQSGGEGNDLLAAHGYAIESFAIDGDAGDDTISAWGYSNYGYIATGSVSISGGDGNDDIAADLDVASLTIDAGSGDDRITIDSWMFSTAYYGHTGQSIAVTTGEGRDTITLSNWFYDRDNVTEVTDFTAGAGGDVLDLNTVFAYLPGGWDGVSNPFGGLAIFFEQRGADTVLVANFGSGEIVLITLANVDMTTLTRDNIAGGYTPTGATLIEGTDTDDWLYGSHGADTINGYGGADHLYGNGGNDSLNGGSGDDTLSGGAGADTLRGASGLDIVDYSASGSGVSIDLSTWSASGGDAEGDTLTEVDGIIGSSYNDTLIGFDQTSDEDEEFFTNIIHGGAGNDVIDGRGADDQLYGEDGDDTVLGGDGNDLISDGSGINLLQGGAGNDTIYSGGGNATIAGGAGNDYISATWYWWSSTGGTFDISGGDGNDTIYVAEYAAAPVTVDGDAGDDTIDLYLLYDFDITVNGGDGNDLIIADASGFAWNADGTGYVPAGTMTIAGGDGNDTVQANIEARDALVDLGAGDDLISIDGLSAIQIGFGATGDSLRVTTGTGRDRIALTNWDVSHIGALVVTDFTAGAAGDTLDLSAVLGTILAYAPTGWDGVTDPFVTGLLSFEQVGANAVLVAHLATGDLTVLTLENTDALDLVSENLYPPYELQQAIEITGSNGADRLRGTAAREILLGLGGNDMLTGSGGADTLDGGAGTDKADYTASTAGVIVDLAAGTGAGGDAEGDILISIEKLRGSEHDDTLIGDDAVNGLDGGKGDDLLSGAGGNDNLAGGAGDDTLSGGAGKDVLDGGAGADVIDGGEGVDKVSYARSTAGISIDLSGMIFHGGDAEGDVLTNVETIIGSKHADAISGAASGNLLSGGDGNDTLSGLGGVDTLNGDDGDDLISGGAGNDELSGGAGADTIDGGAGTDRVSYAGSDVAVVIDLNGGTCSGGDAAGDVLTGIEVVNGSGQSDVLIGTTGAQSLSGGNGNDTLSGLGDADTLTGGNGDDVLDGGDGADRLTAGNGNDVLIGGTGNDTLSAGAGDDCFVFNTDFGRDLISDFRPGDTIQISDDLWLETGAVDIDSFLADSAVQVGRAVEIHFSATDVLRINGVTVGDLMAHSDLFLMG